MHENTLVELLISMMQKTIQAITNELDELIINSRWLGSLVLASIAGLVGYQNLIGIKKLTIPFALISVILAFTMIFFIAVTILARQRKKEINLKYIEISENINRIITDRDLTPNLKDEQLKSTVFSQLKIIQKYSTIIIYSEVFGLCLLVVAALVTVFYIFITELL